MRRLHTKTQEPYGKKTQIHIQVIRCERRKKLKSIGKHDDGLNKYFMQRIGIPTDCITTPVGIAEVVRKNYGFGVFSVMVWSNNVHNKNYSPKFECCREGNEYKGFCGYYDNGSCKVWKRFKTGMQCRHNRKIISNWMRVARVEIIPNYDEQSGRDYTFKWYKRFSRMKKFWFWKGI